jgi:hypothetical protein
VENHDVVNRAPDAAKEALQCIKMWLSGIMHMKADLLNNIRQVHPGNGEVLQGTSKTPKSSRICHRSTHICRQLRLSVKQDRQ